MRLKRREFIVGGLMGGALGCQSARTGSIGPRPIQLEVYFSGLCGIVHRRGRKVSEALLVDAAATQTLGNVPHSPRLVTAAANFQSGLAPTIQNGQASWDLTDFKVTLANGDMSGTTEVTGRRPPGQQRPTPNSARDVTWVAQMPRLPGTGRGKINPINLSDTQRPPQVAARVQFAGGEFAARFRPGYDQVLWQIGTGAQPPFAQAIGEPMVSQSVNDQRVTFQLQKYGSSTSSQLVLAPAGGTTTLVVEVMNMPTHHQQCVNPAAQRLDHFAAYYELLQTPPAPSNRPVPECPTCPDCDGKMDEPVYCPATEYNEQ